MNNNKIKYFNKYLSTLALIFFFIVLPLNAEARGSNVDNISSSNNYSVNKLDFTLPFHLIDGYIFIDGQVNKKKGKFMFDTAASFAFFLNNHFIPLAKDNYLSKGYTGSGQLLVLHTQNQPVSVNLTEQIKFAKLKSLPHSNFNFIENAVVKSFLGITGHAFNKDYLFIINYDDQTIEFHSLKQNDKSLSHYIDNNRIIAILPFIAKDDGRKPELEFLIGTQKVTGIFDTGNPGSLTLTQDMKTRLENEGYLSVEKKDYSYGRYEPHLSCTLRKLMFNGHALNDIHNIQLRIGNKNELWLGYQFLKSYISVWDYKNKIITLLER